MESSSVSPSLIRSEEGLKLETSAFQICHGGNSTFFNSFDKTKLSYFTLPPTQHDSFFRNYKFEFLFSLVKRNYFSHSNLAFLSLLLSLVFPVVLDAFQAIGCEYHFPDERYLRQGSLKFAAPLAMLGLLANGFVSSQSQGSLIYLISSELEISFRLCTLEIFVLTC